LTESARLDALDSLRMLDTAPEERFDRVVRLAQRLFDVPTVAVNLVDEDRQWAKASIGLPTELPRSHSFCSHTIRRPGTMVVPDAQQDERFRDNPLVTGDPHIRFYAGHPLTAPGGQPVGALCILDDKPRTLTETETRLLVDLADWVEKELASDAELLEAAEVQRRLLPQRPLPVPGFEIAGRCVPARSVGGDFYDWYTLRDGTSHQVVLGDVMGKGVAAAMIATSVRALVRGASRFNSLDEAVTRVGFSLDPDLDELGSFVTLFAARLRSDEPTIEYVDAGHGLAIVLRASGESRRLRSCDLPLGALPGGRWTAESVELGVGDSLVVVSDGILDLFDDTEQALGALIDAHRRVCTAGQLVDEVARFTAARPVEDDVTCVVIRRSGS
jgi:Stage II sporulation protein E (SpoIIE)/GAF domain